MEQLTNNPWLIPIALVALSVAVLFRPTTFQKRQLTALLPVILIALAYHYKRKSGHIHPFLHIDYGHSHRFVTYLPGDALLVLNILPIIFFVCWIGIFVLLRKDWRFFWIVFLFQTSVFEYVLHYLRVPWW